MEDQSDPGIPLLFQIEMGLLIVLGHEDCVFDSTTT